MTTLINYVVLSRDTLHNVKVAGGSTLSAVPGVPTVSNGYAVSLPDNERIIHTPMDDGDAYLLAEIVRYIHDKRAELSVPGRYLGAWMDGDKLYLDVTEVHSEFGKAVQLGWQRGELAIYELHTGREIRTSLGEREAKSDVQRAADELAVTNGWAPQGATLGLGVLFLPGDESADQLISDNDRNAWSVQDAQDVRDATAKALAPFEVVGAAEYDAATDTLK
jgi:hypothetical protein